MDHCSNCSEPQETPDGVINFIDGMCEHCWENKEKMEVVMRDIIESQDFDFTMN